MKKLQFTVEINAPASTVWNALWEDKNYREWVSVFMAGSFMEGALEEGNKVLFLGENRDGMYAIVEQLVPNEKMYFLHKGEIKDGVEQEGSFGEDAIERYDLTEKEGKTELTLTMNVPEEYIVYFTSTFPNALNKVKEIAES